MMKDETIENLKLAGAIISVVIHATEDKEKVKSKIIQSFSLNSTKFQEVNTEGHWGNEISLLSLSLEQTEAGHLIRKIYGLLDNTGKDYFINSLRESVDEKNNLYIRINKQKLCSGRIELSDKDSIKVKFKPLKTFKQSNKTSISRELLSSKL